MLCVSCRLVQAWERAEVAAPKADTVGSICGGVMVHQGSMADARSLSVFISEIAIIVKAFHSGFDGPHRLGQ